MIFDYNSSRSKKARLSIKVSKAWLFLIKIGSLLLLSLGLLNIFYSSNIGWLLIGLTFIPAMFVEWCEEDLKKLAINQSSKTIDGMLSIDILGKLSSNPTPNEIAIVVGQSNGGQFMAVRFGISANLLINITDSIVSSDDIWNQAIVIANNTKSNDINGAVLSTAIVFCSKVSDGLLSQMKLDKTSLINGINWYNHLDDLIESYDKPMRTGGIARDWSFGYTPLLQHFGHSISSELASGSVLFELGAHKSALDELVNAFKSNGRQNAVLVGPAGVGKTTIVYAFAKKLLDASANLPDNLKFRQIFLLDPASLIAAAPGKGELENLVIRILNEAYSAKNIIICLDNAQLFFEEGIGSVDLTNILLPILNAGQLRVILTMDEQKLLQINQKNSELVNSLNRINVVPASKEETIAILEDKTIITENQYKVIYTYQSITEAYRLGERYIYDLAMPGKAFKLLEMSAKYGEGRLITANSVHQAIEKTMGIKIGAVDSSDERDKLLHLEELIHQRMVDQSRAVTVVCDALRRARAGVRNENKPIGTFLFLGPTGVGKTELAKSLAAVYFNGEDRLIRVNLNEYINSNDADRLIADGASNPDSLTAQIMKQPFSVVLLDEIEKAHPDILNMLLQLLDEGVLLDANNREISFRDSIIIATSNAGADRIREYIDRGYKLEQFEGTFVNELINSHIFKPEFLNRFDEIVVFKPLGEVELLKVVDIIIDGINKTLSPQGIKVEVESPAKELLAQKGYDPRLGARPLKRVVQKTVENLVAQYVLSGNLKSGQSLVITKESIEKGLENIN